jgi:hypothetical protein
VRLTVIVRHHLANRHRLTQHHSHQYLRSTAVNQIFILTQD